MIDPLEEAELHLYAAWHAQAEDVIPSDKYQEMLTNFKTRGFSNQANGIFHEELFIGYLDRKEGTFVTYNSPLPENEGLVNDAIHLAEISGLRIDRSIMGKVY